MGLLRHLARLAAVTALLGGTATLVAAASPAASAAAAPAQDAWVRIAHLSPRAPAMDIYLYPFGEPGQPIVLRDVSYGDVSAYMAVSPGQYSVAMRGFGAPPSSPPALITSFMVSAGGNYTVASLGPASARRLEVLTDQVSGPSGSAMVRVVQASLKEPQVTVSIGSDVLARQLAFGAASVYQAVPPGASAVTLSTSGGHSTAPVTLAAGSVHTIVVLDGTSGLKIDTVTDTAASMDMNTPKGGAATGLGGTAPAAPAVEPWLVTLAGGLLLVCAGVFGLRRSRRTAAAHD